MRAGRLLRAVAAGVDEGVGGGELGDGAAAGADKALAGAAGAAAAGADLLADAASRLDPALRERLAAAGLDEDAQNNLAALVRAQREATGVVPDDKTLVVERCEDETGDWRVMLHSPYGRQVHEPWAMAVQDRVERTLGFDPQAMAADDGILLRVPMTETRLPGAELFAFDPDELVRIVRDRVDKTALFAARFRECAARALLMSPTQPGKRAPLWQQRLKAGQLLEAARGERDFPILLETARECLQDVYDLDALPRAHGGACGGHRAHGGGADEHPVALRRARSCSATWASTCTRATCRTRSARRRCCRWTRRSWASSWARPTWASCWTRRWWPR